jgi:acyl CoA:acetate/3-ketoacid CoA transferase beta subunit
MTEGGADHACTMGGAMDMVADARAIRVIIYPTSKKGEPRILKACAYSLTAAGCVSLAVIDVTPGLLLRWK